MSEVNPNNWDGATVTIVGRTGGPVKVKEFEGGGSVAELSIAVSQGYTNKTTNQWVDKGSAWYTLTAAPDYASENWPEVGTGDKVRVDDAKLETRTYTKKDSTEGLQLTLKYGTLSVVEKKEEVPADLANGF